MRFGVVTGLKIEAGRFAASDPEQLIASAAAAETGDACRRLLDAGAEALLGFGLAGGLAADIGSGEIVVANAVRLPSGTLCACDEPWTRHLQRVLARRGGPVHAGLLYGADHVVSLPAEKRALAVCGALAVDTESHHLAAAAVQADRPFAIVRVVVDRARDRLPPFVADSYGADGGLRIGLVLVGLLRRPGELPALVRLALQSRRALATLGGIGRLGPALGPP